MLNWSMANLATKAPNFTLENAKFMAYKSVLSRQHNAKREKEAYERGYQDALNLKPTDETARRNVTLLQIDRLDAMINKSLDEQDSEAFLKLSGAKEKLWKLVQPTAGVARPKRNREPVQPVQPLD